MIFLVLFSLLIDLLGLEWNPLTTENNGTTKPQASHVEWTSQQVQIDGRMQFISAIRFKPGKAIVKIANHSYSTADSVSAIAKRYQAIAAINGSYFNTKSLYPVTYIKDDNVVEGATTPSEIVRTNGLICTNGKKVKIYASDSLHYQKYAKNFPDAMASGPVLLLKGKPAQKQWPLTSFFVMRHPRTFVGTTRNGYVYFVVVDGRAEGKAAGMTIPEIVALAQALGLRDAINLDGGGSSTLWTVQQGVISHPCDNKQFDHYGQRIVPNILFIQRK